VTVCILHLVIVTWSVSNL